MSQPAKGKMAPLPNLNIMIDDASDPGDSLDFQDYAIKLAQIIQNSYPKFSVGIFGGWGTGKTTLMNMIMELLEKNDKIVTVWFDAWRYEREEHLAVIPFLRTVKLRLDDNTKSPKAGNWEIVKNAVERAAIAFIKSTKMTYGIPGILSAETEFGEVTDSLKGDGSVGTDANTIYYHVTGFLEKALKDLRKGGDTAYRIVVFVDDLDRCTPSNGLEVLESVKSFFDIEGMVYVIGMNHKTINFLVQKKYESDENITGFDYMKKIVQLPFHIPDWYESDIESFVKNTITNKLTGALQKEFLNNIDIIKAAIESNPREVKRFINSVILAKAVFGDLPVDNLIIIQALKFSNEWNKFLDFLLNVSKDDRLHFFQSYEKLVSFYGNSSSVIEGSSNTLEEVYKRKTQSSDFETSTEFADLKKREGVMQYYSVAKEIISLYPDVEVNHKKFLLIHNPLNRFLSAVNTRNKSTVINNLANIKNIESYRRAVRTSTHEPGG